MQYSVMLLYILISPNRNLLEGCSRIKNDPILTYINLFSTYQVDLNKNKYVVLGGICQNAVMY
jgi:hypothetical protein